MAESSVWRVMGYDGCTITTTTVIAEDATAAAEKAERQLTKNPARIPYYDEWVFGGRKVVTAENLEQASAELRLRHRCWHALWSAKAIRRLAEKVSPELAELAERPDSTWVYRKALITLIGDLW